MSSSCRKRRRERLVELELTTEPPAASNPLSTSASSLHALLSTQGGFSVDDIIARRRSVLVKNKVLKPNKDQGKRKRAADESASDNDSDASADDSDAESEGSWKGVENGDEDDDESSEEEGQSHISFDPGLVQPVRASRADLELIHSRSFFLRRLRDGCHGRGRCRGRG